MATHELKCWPVPYQAVVDGAKTYELRVDDRGFAEGDRLMLREWRRAVGETGRGCYTGRVAMRIVTYISRDGPWLQPGHVCMAIGVPARPA